MRNDISWHHEELGVVCGHCWNRSLVWSTLCRKIDEKGKLVVDEKGYVALNPKKKLTIEFLNALGDQDIIVKAIEACHAGETQKRLLEEDKLDFIFHEFKERKIRKLDLWIGEKRTHKEQKTFKNSLIEFYQCSDKSEPRNIFCMILNER
jgi:hypothetical protein